MYRWTPVLLVAGILLAGGCGKSVPRVEITEAADNKNGTLTVKYNAREFFSASIDIVPAYSTPTVMMAPATSGGGDGVTGLATTSEGTAHTFVWDYKTDLGPGRHRGITFTIAPYGPDGRGRSGVIGPLDVGCPLLFSANQGDDKVAVVDTTTQQVSSTVSVGNAPCALAVLPDESRLFVANKGSNSVSVIDIDDLTSVLTVPVGPAPSGLAASPDGTRVYSVNSADGTVSMIDSSLGTPIVLDTYTVGTTPFACSLTANGEALFVTNSGDDTVSILLASDGSPLRSPIPAGPQPMGISTSIRYTVVCNYGGATVSVIDNSDLSSSPVQVAVGSQPVAVVMNASCTFAYVANSGSESVSIVNLTAMTVVGTISLNSMGSRVPQALALDSAETSLYVAETPSYVAKIDLVGLVVSNAFPVGASPSAVVILSE